VQITSPLGGEALEVELERKTKVASRRGHAEECGAPRGSPVYGSEKNLATFLRGGGSKERNVPGLLLYRSLLCWPERKRGEDCKKYDAAREKMGRAGET